METVNDGTEKVQALCYTYISENTCSEEAAEASASLLATAIS